MGRRKKSHLLSIFQALLVTFLWSTSFILIKIGLGEIPPVTYAGLRYSLAFLIFIPLVLRKKYRRELSGSVQQTGENCFYWESFSTLSLKEHNFLGCIIYLQ